MSRGTCIHWFRKGLRLSDNPALLSSFELHHGGHLELRPVFVLDPWFVKNYRVGENRWRFLAQSLQDLDDQLKTLGSRLFVIRGSPKDVFQDLFKQWNVKRLTYESDTEPYSVKRDEEIGSLAAEMNIEIVSKLSHTLYDPRKIVKANKGATPMTYEKFRSVAGAVGKPAKPVEAVSKANFPKECLISKKSNLTNDEFDVPTLKELGVDETKLETCKFPGGETEGLKRLSTKICEANGKWVRSFEKPSTFPNSLEPSTTVLSPYLKFGCISCRDMYYRLAAVNSKGNHSQPPVSLVGQLLWREFFYTCGATIDNFNKMKGNKVCRQIPWRSDKEKYLEAWKDGKTGYPFIDAIMTQLKKEGWIHHLARHSVACFLTRGDLWVSWEDGQAVFEELLLDADWSLNAANWMWLSASAFFHQYYRVYGPVSFGKKTDPLGSYIKKYVPVLAKFSKDHIYEPWKAPLSVQKAAGCIIGQDYPRPIVDHDSVHKENIQKMKAAYAGGKKEDDKKEVNKKEGNKKGVNKKEENSTGKKRKSESQDKITKFIKKK